MTYKFYYIDQSGNKTVFTNLSKRKAVMMYNIFLKDIAINNYKTFGWDEEK